MLDYEGMILTQQADYRGVADVLRGLQGIRTDANASHSSIPGQTT